MIIIKQKKSRIDIGLLLTIYITLKPLYIYSSGTLQIADLFFLVGFIGILLKNRFKIKIRNNKILGLFSFIVIYQLIINFTWFFVLGNSDLIHRVFYYVFNYLVFIVCIQISNEVGNARTIQAIADGCYYGSVVSFAGLIFGGLWSSSRRAGFFNNPNQLGYFALLILTFSLLYPDSLSRRRKITIYAIALVSILLSASKAAFVGVFVIAVFYTLFGYNKSTMKAFFVKLFALFTVGVALYIVLYSNSNIIISNRALYIMRSRIMNRGLELDNEMWSGRGYGRIAEMGFHYIFGMGEGAYERFNIMHGVEANTTYITILVSYGLVGFLAFLVLFFKFFKQPTKWESLYVVACMSGVLFYFFSHNALRNTVLWIILSVVSMAGVKKTT